VVGYGTTNLKLFRQFFLSYPGFLKGRIGHTMGDQSFSAGEKPVATIPAYPIEIGHTPCDQLWEPGMMHDGGVGGMAQPRTGDPSRAGGGIAQFQLVHIHPFLDGNGRTSRLLSTLCLYRAGYDFKRLFTISEYYDRDRSAFYEAIQNVRETGMDMTGWLEYFIMGLTTQLAEVRERGEQAIRRDGLSRSTAFRTGRPKLSDISWSTAT
jgi:hypothetical protein